MLRQSHSVIRSLSLSHPRSITLTASTSAQKHRQPPQLDEPQLPRWFRRQNLQKGKAKEQDVLLLPPAKVTSKFRSKHLNSEKQVVNKDGLKLLEPHVLSQRLRKLCERGKLEDAVSLLKNSPLDAQNTPVWNTLIWEAMKAKRYKLGYSLYVDVRSHSNNPNIKHLLISL